MWKSGIGLINGQEPERKHSSASDNMTAVTIKAFPKSALLDEIIGIRVTNLLPNTSITLLCRVHEPGIKCFSYGYYTSDIHGSVNTETTVAEKGGCYDGIEPMGFVWSLKAEPGQNPGRRLVKRDITTSIVTNLYVLQGRPSPEQCLEDVTNRRWVAYTSVDRHHLAEGVERVDIRIGRLIGTLFLPKGPGPFPGIIDLFGSIGGVVEHRSALLASRGIMSFALGYYALKDGTSTMDGDLEYFEEAADFLLAHPRVMRPKVGIIGVSLGANIALMLGSLCHKIGACAEINGLPIFCLFPMSYQGKEYEIFNFYDLSWEKEEEGYDVRKQTEHLITEDILDRYAVPVERGSCEFLLIHGGDDRSAPPVAAEYIPRRLQRFGRSNYRVLLYPDAGHLIEPPHSPHFRVTHHALFADMTIWGGKTKQHARAQEDAWKQTLDFFKTTLTREHDKLLEHKIVNSNL